MGSEEALDKVKEAVAEGRERKQMAPVSLTMAILAVMIATVSLLGHRSHTEEILLQNRVTDQWAYYQAKNMRRNNLEALSDVLTALQNTKADRAEEVEKRFHEEIDKYRDQQKDIQNEARGLESEVTLTSRRANRYRPGRGVSGDRTGRHLHHLADRQSPLLVLRMCACGDRHCRRGQRIFSALRRRPVRQRGCSCNIGLSLLLDSFAIKANPRE